MRKVKGEAADLEEAGSTRSPDLISSHANYRVRVRLLSLAPVARSLLTLSCIKGNRVSRVSWKH